MIFVKKVLVLNKKGTSFQTSLNLSLLDFRHISTDVHVVVNDFHDFFSVVAEFSTEVSVVEVLEIFNHIIDDII